MKRLILIAAVLVASATAQAQQSQPTVQDQLYAACGQTNQQLAKMLNATNAQMAELRKQLDAATKDKQGEKKP